MYRPSESTTPTRHRERAEYERDVVHAILDEALVCHMGFVIDGEPVVLPTLFARVGERLYLHGSTGSRPLRLAGEEGLPVCVTVTLLDGLVLARSAFHHSMNYRSVVVRGRAGLLRDAPDDSDGPGDSGDSGDKAKRAALDAILDKVVSGRSTDCRPPTGKELASTAVLALDLDEVSAKVRSGGVNDEPEDMELPHWAGIVPWQGSFGTPEPDAHLPAGVHVPGYLSPG